MNPNQLKELQSVLRRKQSSASSPSTLRRLTASESPGSRSPKSRSPRRTPSGSPKPGSPFLPHTQRSESPAPGFDFDVYCQDLELLPDTREKLEREDLVTAAVLAEVTEEELKEIGITLGQRKAIRLGAIYLQNATLERAVLKRDNMYSIKRSQASGSGTQSKSLKSSSGAKRSSPGAKRSSSSSHSSSLKPHHVKGSPSTTTTSRSSPSSSSSLGSSSSSSSSSLGAKGSPGSTRSSKVIAIDDHVFPMGDVAKVSGHLYKPLPPKKKKDIEDSLDLFRKKKDVEDSIDSFWKKKKNSVANMEENSEVIADLDKRIAEVEADIQRYKEQRDEATRLLEEGERGDGEGSLEQAASDRDDCHANITGLTEELMQLKENLYAVCPSRLRADQQQQQQRDAEERLRRQEQTARQQQQEQSERRRDQRERVIQEIVQTEKDYLQSLSLCMETFQTEELPQGIERSLLFGNMAEVTEVSQKLLNQLEEATSGKEFDEKLIGECFVQGKKEMKAVYAPYCRNHDDVIALLEKYEEDEEVQEFFNRHLDTIRKQCNAFDLGSVLIKPVQRILKYPLLLNELYKNTEEDHPDKMHLLAAINCMTDVASAINEFKRRKDLVRKYREDNDTKLSEKFAKLNVHSTKKKFIRLSQKMVGIQTIDPNYNQEERKFKCLENAVKLLVRDAANYLDQLQDAACGEEATANDMSDFYSNIPPQPEVDKFCRVHNQIAARLYPHFRGEVQRKVLAPLQTLLGLLDAPQKVMKKRYDKLLDYDNIRTKMEGQDGSGSELEAARVTYTALNDQLLDELPQLYNLGGELLKRCMAALTRAQKHFYNAALTEMYQMLGLQLVLSPDSGGIVDAFNITHTQAVDTISTLSFIPRAFNPRIEEKRPKGRRVSELPTVNTPADRQSDSQKQYVRQLYSSTALYEVTDDYMGGGAMMELVATRGTLVGLIKEGDPMGNKERWYVDNGASKGFLPKKLLQPPHASSLSSTSNPAAPGGLNSDLLGLDPVSTATSTSPLPWNSSQYPQSISFDQSQRHLQPSPGFDQSGAILQPSPVFNESGSPLQPGTGQSGGRLQQASPVFDFEQQGVGGGFSSQSGSPCQEQSRSRSSTQYSDQSRESLSPGAPPVGRATPAPSEEEMYQAVYDFASRTPLELTIREGEMLQIVQKRDNDGNSEWWLAVNEAGQRGYIPSNYVYKLE